METDKDKFCRTLFELADSGKFITGIYNYCDRWCERCTLSHKCITYAHENEMRKACCNPQTNEIDDDKFWEQIRISLEVTFDLITEDAKKMGISLDEVHGNEEDTYEPNDVENLALEYAHKMTLWIEEFEESMEFLSLHPEIKHLKNIPVIRITDAIEVVKWYYYFISTKIHRAYFDIVYRNSISDEDFDAVSDNIGSAKVTILAVNRSIEALSVLYECSGDQEDQLLEFLSMLSRIKEQLLTDFPLAMAFKRPGFDD